MSFVPPLGRAYGFLIPGPSCLQSNSNNMTGCVFSFEEFSSNNIWLNEYRASPHGNLLCRANITFVLTATPHVHSCKDWTSLCYAVLFMDEESPNNDWKLQEFLTGLIVTKDTKKMDENGLAYVSSNVAWKDWKITFLWLIQKWRNVTINKNK